MRELSALIWTETWLHDNILDSAVRPDVLVCLRQNLHIREDRRRTAVCVYVNTGRCTDARIINSYCSTNVGYLLMKCRARYLPREFTVIIIVAVYNPLRASIKDALGEPSAARHHCWGFQSSKSQGHTTKGERTTRRKETPDYVYPKNTRCPHVGHSDHMLISSYKPLEKWEKTTTENIKVWPEGASAALQHCFDCTDWNVFKEAAAVHTVATPT